mmetsp:Transcript_16846/g.23169  ORF Transcript_16846/g.23169 Transcript_16846/m.23169 type:complete len:303 (+) Transcript_16846:923-1831(+)
MEDRAVLGRHGPQRVLCQRTRPEEGRQLDQQVGEAQGGVVLLGGFVGVGADDVAVGGRAQIGQGYVVRAALGHQLGYDCVHCQGHLHVQSPVQVRVAAHHQLLPPVHLAQPVRDLRRLGEQVAPGVLRVVRLDRAGRHVQLQREGQRARGVPGDGHEPSPHGLAVQVDGDDVGPQRHEQRVGAHGGAGAQQHEVPVAQVQPLVLVLQHAEDGVAAGGLDGAVPGPGLYLRDDGRAPQHLPLVVDLQLARVDLGLLPLEVARAERALEIHGLLEAHGLPVPDELKVVVRPVHASLSRCKGLLL